MEDKLPPASIPAEESILGGIMLDPQAIYRIKDWLPVHAFYVTAHQMIYQASLALVNEGKECNFILLTDWLGSRQLLEDVGGTTKLAHLLNQTVSASNLDRYAKLVLDKYKRRQIITLGYKIVELGYDPYMELTEIYEEIRSELPEEMSSDLELSVYPSVSQAVYRVTNPDNELEQIELTANIDGLITLEDAMADIKVKADGIVKRVWHEQKKSPPMGTEEEIA